jgi:F-type H+-transporting ATPase subunit b
LTRQTLMLLFWTLATAALAVAAEEHGGDHGDSHASVDMWKTVNFTILAIGLGWLVKKFGLPFFRSRSEEIKKGIVDARKLKEDSEARAAEMEQRLTNLDGEIAELKSSAKEEMAAEEARLKKATELATARMEANAKQEISSATKHARKELRAYSAELALELATRKVRARMSPEVSGRLIDSFAADLGRLPRRVK